MRCFALNVFISVNVLFQICQTLLVGSWTFPRGTTKLPESAEMLIGERYEKGMKTRKWSACLDRPRGISNPGSNYFSRYYWYRIIGVRLMQERPTIEYLIVYGR